MQLKSIAPFFLLLSLFLSRYVFALLNKKKRDEREASVWGCTRTAASEGVAKKGLLFFSFPSMPVNVCVFCQREKRGKKKKKN